MASTRVVDDGKGRLKIGEQVLELPCNLGQRVGEMAGMGKGSR